MSQLWEYIEKYPAETQRLVGIIVISNKKETLLIAVGTDEFI
jgi:hypothetical protein